MFEDSWPGCVINKSIKEYEKDPERCMIELRKIMATINKNEWRDQVFYMDFVWLAQSGYVELMKIFIEFIDIHYVNDWRTTGDRMLAEAIKRGKEEMVNYLLSIGAVPLSAFAMAYRVNNKKMWLLLYNNDPERLYALNKFLIQEWYNVSWRNHKSDLYGALAYLPESEESNNIIAKLIKMYEDARPFMEERHAKELEYRKSLRGDCTCGRI